MNRLVCQQLRQRARSYSNHCYCTACVLTRDLALDLDTPPDVAHMHSEYQRSLLRLLYSRYSCAVSDFDLLRVQLAECGENPLSDFPLDHPVRRFVRLSASLLSPYHGDMG